MPLNPYASDLGGADPVTVVAATVEKIMRLWKALPPDRRAQPVAPGKWSPKEIVCHLADTEVVWAFRLRQALAEDHHVIQPMDQDAWARHYGSYDGEEAVEVLTALRRWNVALVRSVVPIALERPLTHPERGEMTFKVLLETMAGHDAHHVAQLERL